MANQNEQERDLTQPIKPRRPILLTLIIWIFAFWTLLGWLRFFRALTSPDLILSVLPTGLYGTILLTGFVWGLLGLPVLWGLARGANWTPKILWIAAVFYPVSYWFERLFLWQDPNAQSNWPIMLMLTFVWFGLVLWVYRSKRVKQFFKDEDQKGKQ